MRWVRPLRRIVCLLDGEIVPFDLRALRALRLFRLFRLLKLLRYSPALLTLKRVIAQEYRALLGALLVMMTLMLFSAAVIYFLERDAQPEIVDQRCQRAGGAAEAGCRFECDQQQVDGLAEGHRDEEQAAALRPRQQQHDAEEIDQQPEPGQRPEQQAEAGIAPPGRMQCDRGAVVEAHLDAVGGQCLAQCRLLRQLA